jgi:hypothetical protein
MDSTVCNLHGSLSRIKKWSERHGGQKKKKASGKLHVIWNVDGEWIQDFKIAEARMHDMKAAREFKIQPNCHYIFDRAYNDINFW